VRDALHLDLSEEFLEAIERELAPDSFAIVAEIDEDWLAPLDTRMEELGGKVVREEREAFRDELIERRVNAGKAELERRKAEHAQRKAARAAERAGSKAVAKEQSLTAEIDDARRKLEKMAEKAERRLDDMKQELTAKVDALQQQAASARPDVRSRIDERIADIRRELAEREQKLTRAKELTQEALQP
jgi:DNA anti-recombination protein RmuC